MKLQIEKKDLLEMLAKTQNIIERKNNMHVLMNVLIQTEANQFRVYATDLEVSIKCESVCTTTEPGKLAVHAKNLFDITKELSDGPVNLIKKDNNWLEIKQGRYSSRLVGVSADEYPIFPAHSSDKFGKMDPKQFKKMIDQTLYCVSTDDTRYYLNGVFFEFQSQDGLKMVATDGHRLALVKSDKVSFESIFPYGVIVPRKGLHEIRKLMESVEVPLEIAIEGSQFIVKSDSTLLLIRLIEGKYPNYQQFIPQQIKYSFQVQRDSFLGSLRRISLFANQKSRAITLNLLPGKMEMSSNNPDLGDALEEMEIQYTGAPTKINFNSKYLQDALGGVTSELIEFQFNDNLSPTLLKGVNDNEYLSVVMPMRI